MTKFFSDDNGNPSILRVQFFIVSIAAICFGCYAVVKESALSERLSYTFLAVGFSGKVAQKCVEVANNGKN